MQILRKKLIFLHWPAKTTLNLLISSLDGTKTHIRFWDELIWDHVRSSGSLCSRLRHRWSSTWVCVPSWWSTDAALGSQDGSLALRHKHTRLHQEYSLALDLCLKETIYKMYYLKTCLVIVLRIFQYFFIRFGEMCLSNGMWMGAVRMRVW